MTMLYVEHNKYVFERLINYELACSKRFCRYLTILSAEIIANAEDVLENVKTIIRQADCIFLFESRLFILLPETNYQGAFILINRIEKMLSDEVKCFSIASFPTDGLTFEDLIKKSL